MIPEYLPWYQPNQNFVRCSACGCVVLSGDTEVHTHWHEGN